MAIMCVAYIFISLSFQFCNGIFLYSVLKFLFIQFCPFFVYLSIWRYLHIYISHSLCVCLKRYILKIQGENGLFCIFCPFLAFSTVRYTRIVRKGADWEHRGVKESRKRKNKSHLGKFFDYFFQPQSCQEI